MTALISFDEFSDLVSHGSGILLFVLTPECNDAAARLGDQLRRSVGQSAAVHVMYADVEDAPVLVFYEGGDQRPLVRRSGSAVGSAAELLIEALRLAASRPSAAAEAREQAEAAAQTEHMLASERLDRFPPFFQMARSLARDAWHAARQSAGGAPLLLGSEAAAARLQVCQACPSLRIDRCQECGCYITVKAHIAAMRCPLDKWPDANSPPARFPL